MGWSECLCWSITILQRITTLAAKGHNLYKLDFIIHTYKTLMRLFLPLRVVKLVSINMSIMVTLQ